MKEIIHYDKNIPCPISHCYASFTQIGNLVKHIRTVHVSYSLP